MEVSIYLSCIYSVWMQVKIYRFCKKKKKKKKTSVDFERAAVIPLTVSHTWLTVSLFHDIPAGFEIQRAPFVLQPSSPPKVRKGGTWKEAWWRAGRHLSNNAISASLLRRGPCLAISHQSRSAAYLPVCLTSVTPTEFTKHKVSVRGRCCLRFKYFA